MTITRFTASALATIVLALPFTAEAATAQTLQVTAFAVAVPAPAFVKSQTISVKTFSATDSTGGGGLSGYLITESSIPPLTTDSGWSATKPASYTTVNTGSVTLYPWVKDKAGNVSAATGGTQVNIDITKPTVDAFSVPPLVNTLTVPVAAFSASDPADGNGSIGSGVNGYRITTSATAPSATATGWSPTPPATYAFGSSGTKTLYAWARDAAGNVSLPKTATVLIDRSKPTVTLFTPQHAVNSTTVPIVAFTAADNSGGSGVAAYMITENATAPLPGDPGWGAKPASYTVQGAWTPGKTKTLYAWAKDEIGNVSSAKTAAMLLDTTAPVVSAFHVVAAASGYIRSQTIPITTFSASDNSGGSGLAGYLVTESSTPPTTSDNGWSSAKPTSYTTANTGSVTLYAWVKDKAGNVSAAGGNPGSGNVAGAGGLTSATVNIDISLPTVSTFTVSSPVNTLTVPVTLSASDSGSSGITGYMLTTTATAPLATATGWNATAPTTYTFTATGTKTLYAWARNGAGSVSSPASATVLIDQTRPVVTAFTVAPPANNDTTVPVTAFTASDNVAVVGYLISESSTPPLTSDSGWSGTSPTGYSPSAQWTAAQPLYAWAKDGAGNVSLPKTATAAAAAAGSNIMPISVNGTLCSASTGYPNKPCVSVTVCAPGGSPCQTVNDILLDTGSTGLRIFNQILTVPLTQVTSGSNSLTECVQYGDGSYDWGPVKMASVVLGNEPAVQVPIQVINSTFGGGPGKLCTGTADTSPSATGFNGILGVGLWLQDCGSWCTNTLNNGTYYSCGSTGCSPATAELANQVQNPVALLPNDNNGVILRLPTVALGGAPSVDGSLVLGIGTQTNNTPAGVTAYVTDSNGEFTTTFNGHSYSQSFIDSGSNALYLTDASLTTCSGWYCPSSVASLSATNSGTNSTTGPVPFKVGNANSLFASPNNVFIELGGDALSSTSFDWGLPFFLGRDVYVGFEGNSSSLGSGTYWAY